MESHPRVPIDKNMTLKNAQIIKKQNVWRFVRHNNKITIAARRQTMRARMCQISAKNCGASLKEMSNQIYWLSLFVRNGGSDSSWRPGLIEMWKANDRGRRANNVHLFFFLLLLSVAGSSVWILLVALVDLSCTFPTPNPCLCAIKAPLSTFECLPSDFTSAISDSLRQSVELSSRTPCKIVLTFLLLSSNSTHF